MVDEQQSASDAPGEETAANAQPSGKLGRSLLFAVVGLVVAVGGFYSAFRTRPDPLPEETDSGFALLPESGAIPGGPGLPPGSVPPPASPLDFLRATLPQRPTDVEDLVAEVKKVCETLAEGFSDQSDAWEITGRLYFRLGDNEAATKAWERCIELNAEYGYAYHGLAQIAAKAGDKELAIERFRRALALNPESFDSQIELASALIDTNQLDEAVNVLMDNVVSDPRRYRGRVLLGMAHMQMGDYKKAKIDYEAAIAEQPTHANAHYGLVKACTRLGEQELAKEYMAKYQELREAERKLAQEERRNFDDLETMCIDVAGTYFEAATVCFSSGHLAEAELLLVRAGVLDPTNVRCRQSLAFMYLQINQPAETARVLTELATIEPQNPGYPVEISRILVALGNSLAAEQSLRQASERLNIDHLIQVAQAACQQPDRTAPHYVVLSMAHEIKGNMQQAAESMKQAVELAPDQPEFKQRYDLLQPANGGE